uniref:Uncharacterized protein n=2 Tax=Clytia hemisphaerica TaxID=252671 RepID=A0A7M5V1H7_9CNID
SYSETKVHGIFNRYNLSIPENDDFLTNQNETLLLLELMKTNESVPSALDLKQMLQNNFSDMTNGEFMKAFAPITCKFYNEMCNHDIKSVYSWYGDPQCFQFNSFDEKSGSRKAKMVDGMSGLSIILDLKLEDAFQPDLPFQGAGILVSPYGHPYTIMEGSRNAYIKPGEFSLLKLSAIKNSEVPNPFVDSCGTQPYHIIKEGYPYKREMCWTDCILNNVYQQCDCIGEEMRSEIKLDLKVCTSIKDYSCYKNQRDARMKTEGKQCWDNCRRTCSEMFYDLQFSSGILGSKKMYQNVLNSTSLNKTYSEVQEYLRKNVIGLFITFEDSSIISKHTSQAVSWTDLLSSIGGSIGLCLGFSLITGFEFLFFIFDYMLVPWTLQEETKKGNIGIN